VTNRGGPHLPRGDHRARARHPAVVGCGDATARLKDGSPVTVSCARAIPAACFEGLLPFEVSSRERGEMRAIAVKIAMNVGNPELAFEFANCPTRASPSAPRIHHQQRDRRATARLLEYADLPASLKKNWLKKAAATPDPRSFSARNVKASPPLRPLFWPKPVIVRLSDSSRTSTGSCSAPSATARRRNPMLVSAALRATSRPASASASSWNARR